MRVRCPNCHDSTEVDDNTELSNIACQSCGGEFSLVGEETITLDQTKVQTIGHFELVDQLGTGAFGSVWLARDAQLDRSVAVKIPRKGQLDPSETEQFIREARAAAQLKHPNIVAVHEVGREDGQVYIVSDYVEGLTLADWLVAQQLAARTAAELCVKIAEALHHAHEAGVIHRDLKPTNIIIDRDNEPHIMDFGLAKREAGEVTMTMEGKVLGTPAYMSPEQAKGEAHQADRRSDVYSLGVILYELLTGHKPFRGNVRMLLQQVINEDAPSPRRLNSSIPGDLETVCLKCLEKTPARRYQSARDLADDLKRWLNREPIEARPIGRLERGMRWCQRRPMVASLVGAVIVVAAMGFGGVTWQWRKTEKAASAERAQRRIADTKSKAAAAAERHARQMAETRRQELYTAQVNLAHQAWGDGDLERAQILLASQRPAPNQTDLRGFEWRYLWRLCQDESRLPLGTLTDGTVGFYDSGLMSFSADGGKLAIADGKLVRVWDFASRRELATLDIQDDVWALAFSPTSPDLLAIGDSDRKIQMWDLTANAPPTILATHSTVNALAFSPNGKKLASACGFGDGRVLLWDVETSTQDWSKKPAHYDGEKTEPALCVAFSPDGTLVASGGGDTKIKLWDAETGKQVGQPLEGHSAYVLSLDFSPDGRRLASSGIDSRVFVWDVETRQAGPPLLGHKGKVRSVAFSPDGQTLVSGSDDFTIRCWDVATSRQTSMLRGHTAEVHSLAFSPDGQSLVSMSNNMMKLWEAPPHVEEDVLDEHSGWLDGVVLSPDGRMLAVPDYHAHVVKLWDVRSRGPMEKDLPIPTGGHLKLAFSPDAKWLASGGEDKTVRLWDLSKHEAIPFYCESNIGSVTFSSDSRILGATLHGGGLKFWSVASGSEIELIRGDTHLVRHAVFSPHDALLAVYYQDDKVSVWDTNDAREVTSFPTANIGRMIFSTEGNLIAASGAGGIILFDVRREKIIARLQTRASGVAFTPDSKTLASASYDGTIKLWNVATRQVALTLQHIGPVTGVSFSNDGLLMATSGADATVRLWPAASLNEADASPRTPGTMKQWANAIAFFSEVVRLDPANGVGYQQRGLAYFAKGEFDQAIADHTKAIRLDPEVANRYKCRAEAYLESGQWEKAAKDFERAGELGELKCCFLPVLLFVSAGDTEGYRRACTRLYEQFDQSDDPEIANWLAWICKFGPKAIDDLDRALEFAQKAVASDPDFAKYRNNYAGVLYRVGRYEEAEHELNEAMRLKGGDGTEWQWIWLALVHHHLGNANEASQWLEKARSRIDQSVEGYSWSGRLNFQLLQREAEELMSQTREDKKAATDGKEPTTEERQAEENVKSEP